MSDEIEQRQAILSDIQEQLLAGSLSIGNAAKRLRRDVTGLRQEQFARM
ncbi:MAG TPA: transcriptional regulator, partial [Pseudomonas sp.]|nr:transcriptional regulator [Pseudomonas sp.]